MLSEESTAFNIGFRKNRETYKLRSLFTFTKRISSDRSAAPGSSLDLPEYSQIGSLGGSSLSFFLKCRDPFLLIFGCIA